MPIASSPPADALLMGRAFPAAPVEKKISIPGRPEIVTLSAADGQDLIALTDGGSVMTFALPGAATAAATILPNLRHYSGPVVVIDPGGEYYRATAETRREMGQTVLRLDPFGVIDEFTNALNPFDLLVPGSPTLESDCQEVASLFFPRPVEGGAEGIHLDRAAFGLLAGVLAYQASVPEKRKTSELVRTFNLDDVVYNLAVMLDKIGKQIPPMAYSEIASFLQNADVNRSEIVLRVNSHLKPFMSTEIQKTLDDSEPSLSDILGDPATSIYLIVPPERLKNHSGVINLWLAILFQGILRRQALFSRRALFLLDGCGQLNVFPVFGSISLLTRHHALNIWTFWNDLFEIRHACPGNWPSVVSQCSAIQIFGRRDYAVAAEIEAVFGIPPEELFLLGPDQQLLFTKESWLKIKKL